MFAAVCAILSGLMLLSALPAGATPLSECTPHRGTIVAVDFAHWDGPIVRGCGIAQPTGYALLHAAGFTTAGDAHDGAAFICRIGNQAFDRGTLYPTPNTAACLGTPSTSAYWSYWVAPAGQNSWTYSPIGPMGDTPKPGEVELWMFGATNVGGTHGSGVPKFPPSALRAANPAPRRRPTAASHTRKPTKTTSTATRASSAPAGRVRSTRRPTLERRMATGHREARPPAHKRPRAPGAGHHEAADPAPVVSAQPTSERTSSGSAGPLVVGLCLALALAAGAAWTVWRRRSYE